MLESVKLGGFKRILFWEAINYTLSTPTAYNWVLHSLISTTPHGPAVSEMCWASAYASRSSKEDVPLSTAPGNTDRGRASTMICPPLGCTRTPATPSSASVCARPPNIPLSVHGAEKRNRMLTLVSQGSLVSYLHLGLARRVHIMSEGTVAPVDTARLRLARSRELCTSNKECDAHLSVTGVSWFAQC